MKLSTRSKYGIKAMAILAKYKKEHNNMPISLQTISAEENIPEKYLEQILMVLRKENLIGAVRGANGGYYLIDDPKDITIASIVLPLEGCMISDCIEIECANKCNCKTFIVLDKLDKALTEVLEKMTLESVM